MRIAITQRVEVVASHGERRDCLDQQWAAFLESLGFSMLPVPNNLDSPADWLEALEVDGLLLTGGNDLAGLPGGNNVAPERDQTETALLTAASERQMPVLGVCRGMQMMNHWLGGSLEPVTGHTVVRHQLNGRPTEPLFEAFRDVNSFHDWGIPSAGLAESLVAQLHSDDGYVEAFIHKSLPWAGIMWHPEREAPFCEPDRAMVHRVLRERLCKH